MIPDFVKRLPPAVVVATLEHYARPLAVPVPPGGEALELELPDGSRARLSELRFRGWGDVLPSDYLVLERDGHEPIAAPAPLVVAALRHLATSLAARDKMPM